MKIVLLVEGRTETAFRDKLKVFLDEQCEQQAKLKIGLRTKPMDTRLMNADRVRERVTMSLHDPEVICVIALVDVHPGFDSAQQPKNSCARL
jgi:hypothetical protein